MRTLSGYLFAQFIGTAALLVAVTGMIIVFGKFTDTLNHRPDRPVADALVESLIDAPSTLQFALPFAVLLAGSVGTYRLVRSNEWTILTQTGRADLRFLLVAAAAGLAIGLIYTFLLNPLSLHLKSSGTNAVQSATPDQALRLHDRWGATYLFVGEVSGDGRMLEDVLILRFADREGFEYRIAASSMRWTDGHWKTSADGIRLDPGGTRANGDGPVPLPAGPDEVRLRLGSRFDKSVYQLPRHIIGLRAIGVSTLKLDVQLNRLLSLPLIAATMAVLGGALTLRFARQPILVLLTAVLVLAFAFFAASTVLDTIGRLGVLHPALAMWSLPVATLLFAFALERRWL